MLGVTKNGWRYPEAAPANTEVKNLEWGAQGFDVVGTRNELGTGKENTRLIYNALRARNESGRAAQICRQMTTGKNNDWYLPSREELHWMYLNLHKAGLGNFKNARYWSSTQNSARDAWYIHFGENGRASTSYAKDRGMWITIIYDTGEIWTRAIRSF